MSQDDDIQHGQYDPHRLIFHMSLVGVVICALGILATMIALSNRIGWQIFNLHIDVLGDYLRSPLAYLYNVSLLLAGGCFVLAMLGLYLLRHNRFTLMLSLAGTTVGVGIMLLGVYPYNDTAAHHMAVTFFICTTMVLFSLLVLCRFSHPYLCSPGLWLASLLGIAASVLLLMELAPEALLQHQCPAYQWCYTALLMWWHTLMTMAAGIGLALMARRLLLERNPTSI